MSMIRFVVVAALFGALPAGVAAQQPAPVPSECAEAAGAPYLRCALWLDEHRVRRGAEGAIIAQPGFFSPLRLTRVVEGDSAMHHARRFERHNARAGAFGLLSAAFLAAGFVVANSYDCDPEPTFNICTNSDDDETLIVTGLFVGSFVSAIVSGVQQRRAKSHASRSIFWHNARFAR